MACLVNGSVESRLPTRIRTQYEETAPFDMHLGIHEGCALAPTLLNYVVDWVLNNDLTGYNMVSS